MSKIKFQSNKPSYFTPLYKILVKKFRDLILLMLYGFINTPNFFLFPTKIFSWLALSLRKKSRSSAIFWSSSIVLFINEFRLLWNSFDIVVYAIVLNFSIENSQVFNSSTGLKNFVSSKFKFRFRFVSFIVLFVTLSIWKTKQSLFSLVLKIYLLATNLLHNLFFIFLIVTELFRFLPKFCSFTDLIFCSRWSIKSFCIC